MIQFSARGAYLLLAPQGRPLIRDRVLIRDRELTVFIFLRNNQMFKNRTLINIKITNNNRNCNSNKSLKVQLLLK